VRNALRDARSLPSFGARTSSVNDVSSFRLFTNSAWVSGTIKRSTNAENTRSRCCLGVR